LEEVKIIKKAKSNIAEIMDSGSFIGKYESVQKRYFPDAVIEEYKEPVYESYLTDEDAKILSGTSGPIGTIGPVGFPTVMFETDEIINDPSLVSIGRSRVTGQHVYKYLGDNPRTLNDIGIGWNELI
jgi:hypothetical protein